MDSRRSVIFEWLYILAANCGHFFEEIVMGLWYLVGILGAAWLIFSV
jgi:hypothetical protein